MKKKAVLLLAAIFAGALAFNQVALAASFPDVLENTAHFGAVEYLKAKGVISGYPDGTFQPEKTINRVEALKMVMLATATELNGTAELLFPDVKDTDWFYPYVKKAFEIKIVEGYPDGKFKPASNINLAESVKIILLAFNTTLPDTAANDPYPDVAKNLWYAPYADYAKTKQLIWAGDDGQLHADRDITRGDFAQIIYRLMYIKENKIDIFPLSTDWPGYTHPTDHYQLKYPFDWQKIMAGNQTIFWKQDSANHQISFARIYPNSASVVIAADPNTDRLTLEEYLARIQYDATAKKQTITLNGYPFSTISLADTGITDYYFEFPDKSILAVYAQTGDGLNKPQLSEEIRYLVGSIRYTENTGTPEVSSKEQFLGGIRKDILAAKKGQETMDKFKDLVLIETDTIGIGTGPVDYYYSAEYDVTIKYERNSDTILAINDSKTTAF